MATNNTDSIAELTNDEKEAVAEVIFEDLSHYHEILRENHTSLASAMAEFDVTHLVTALKKLDPKRADRLRLAVYEYLIESF